ncbi:MAG TPA: thermonuclease family protein [Beijerinckiaceae bacterium]|nr:thermonuclease family protein [Beijerinckiaceae bacterium]
MRRLDALVATLLLIGLVAGAAWLLQPEDLVAGFASAVDGDSLRLDGKDIRIAGIDAPELRQSCLGEGRRAYPCGEVARKALSEMIAGRLVTCRVSGRDRYRRRLASCEAGGEDVGAALVARGFALAYGRYEREEAAARDKKLALWSGSFEPPAQWRKTHSEERGS